MDEILRDSILTAGKGLSIGFVPTMGALHQGHLSLVEKAISENDEVVVSIFINPLQFNDSKDFDNYPDEFQSDIEKLSGLDPITVFAPKAEDFYKEKPKLKFDFGDLERVMEGKHRPGHFNGVATVVSRLFNLIRPDRAYFGLKDLQQFLIIKRMAFDLSFPIQIKGLPTQRDSNGLALSSRNALLNETELSQASQLNRSLHSVVRLLKEGNPIEKTINEVSRRLEEDSDFRVEYLELGSLPDLEKVENIDADKTYALCAAAFLGNVRLIDNLILDSDLKVLSELS